MTGIACQAKTLDKLASPPLVGEYCGAPEAAGTAGTWSGWRLCLVNPQGDTWLKAKASVADRHDEPRSLPRARSCSTLARAAVAEDPDDAGRLVGADVTEMFADRLLPRDVRLDLRERGVFLQGSWSQGWQLRIGPG